MLGFLARGGWFPGLLDFGAAEGLLEDETSPLAASGAGAGARTAKVLSAVGVNAVLHGHVHDEGLKGRVSSGAVGSRIKVGGLKGGDGR